MVCTIKFPRPEPVKFKITFRKVKNINLEYFIDDLEHGDFGTDADSIDKLVDKYNLVLKNVLEEHAPTINRLIKPRPHSPWYTESLRVMKRELRRLERRSKKTLLNIDREIFKARRGDYKKLLDQAKSEFYCKKFREWDTKKLFRLINNLLNFRKKKLVLPKHDRLSDLVDSFSNFFESKIISIRHQLEKATFPNVSVLLSESCSYSLTMLTSIDTTEVLRIIRDSPSKTCDLDPIPTSLLKSISSPLIIHISRIINRSLIQGIFPEELKKSLVLPLLKKVSLAPDKLVNYRPISNLSFISKIIERVVLVQLNKYLFDNNLYPDLQSAYRKKHSTETALIKLIDDIGSALDDKLEVPLVLIDLSSAFDTVDHQFCSIVCESNLEFPV